MQARPEQFDRLAALFEASSIPEPNSGCLLWVGPVMVQKRGSYALVNAKFAGLHAARASRVVWAMGRGPIPGGLQVLHRCDNPQCINVDHLFLGTITENMADKVAKGRQCRGESRPLAKLNEEKVQAIRADPRRVGQIARAFGVSHSIISEIRSRKMWSHVP